MIVKSSVVGFAVVAAVAACGASSPPASTVSTAPARTEPTPPVAQASTADVQPPPAETPPAPPPPPPPPPPTREQQCADAVKKLVGDATMAPVARDAQDFTPTAAERKAIGRAVKAMTVEMYGGAEQRTVAAAFDRLIAGGASFEVLQAAKLADRRLVIVTFKLDGVPSLDVGPYMKVVVSEPRATAWRGITSAFYDPDARIIGTVDDNLVFEKLHAPGEPEVWLLSLRKPKDGRDRIKVIKASERCDV